MRNVIQVKRSLSAARKLGSDVIYAQALYNCGKLDEEARDYVNCYIQNALKVN